MARPTLELAHDVDRFVVAYVRYLELAPGEKTTLMEKVQIAYQQLNRRTPFVHEPFIFERGNRKSGLASEVARIRGKKNGQTSRAPKLKRVKKLTCGHWKVIQRKMVSDARWIELMAKLLFVLHHEINLFKRARALRILNSHQWGITIIEPAVNNIEKFLAPSLLEGNTTVVSPYTDPRSLKAIDNFATTAWEQFFLGVNFSSTLNPWKKSV